MGKKTIEFLRTKDFTYLENIGQGGTGKTILIKDETIDEIFVCKKYSPFSEEDKPKYFNYFIDEIKILYKLNHRNIVRVFNYYLYPEQLTGYIIMEYIKGLKIDNYLNKNPDQLNEIFIQVIDGFYNIEQNKILHRDIRPENVLVTEFGVVKIIDFGFGKNYEIDNNFEKSVSLNWRYPVPNEFTKQIYDIKSEVYFVGKLFEEIIKENNLNNFKYSGILHDMIKTDYDLRPKSFFDISRKIITKTSEGFEFSEYDKTIYKNFADSLKRCITKIEVSALYVHDIDTITMNLETILRNSILEDELQNLSAIPRCFIKGQFRYFKRARFLVLHLKLFLELLKSSTDDKKKILINHIWQRLDSIERFEDIEDDLPF